MRRIILACALAGILTAPAFGQSTLREQLVGAWALVSCNNGPFCPNPNGIQILDASGHYAILHTLRGRPKFTSLTQSRDTRPAEEYKAIVIGVQANFGTWSIDEATKTMTWHIEGALVPNNEGTDFKGVISLSGDELRLSTLVWRRIRN